MDLPVGACLHCLKGSFVKKDPEMAYGKCMGCGKVTDCVRGDSIELFIPFIPLLMPTDLGRQSGNQPAKHG